MGELDRLITLDMSDEIAKIPRKPGHRTLVLRGAEEYITYHYSAVVYHDRSREAELRRILAEAAGHINKNWGKKGQPPVYGDGLMYDVVVLSDGTVVRTRKRRQQLWHCNNVIGNAKSWSVHVMLGVDQDLLPAQRDSLFRVFDAIRVDAGGRIPLERVVGHCEWPLIDGQAQISPSYRMLPGQSACPGPLLMRHLYAYRAGSLAHDSEPVSAVGPQRYLVNVDVARVRAQPNTSVTTQILKRLKRGEEWIGTLVEGEAYDGGRKNRWVKGTVAGCVREDLLRLAPQVGG